jgi:hypothetical protein
LERGSRSREVASQQVRSGLLQRKLGEHGKERTVRRRDADRLAGQPVVFQRETDAALVKVVLRPDAVRHRVRARSKARVCPIHLRQPALRLAMSTCRQQEDELEQLVRVGFRGGVAELG